MLIVTTSHEVQGKRITSNDGIVSSWGWFDPKADDAAKQEAWDAALGKIESKAKAMSSNAIIEFTVSYTQCGDDGNLLMTMLGTAVSLGAE